MSGATAACVAPTACAVVCGLCASVFEIVTVTDAGTTSGTAERNVSLGDSADTVGEATDSARRWPLCLHSSVRAEYSAGVEET